MVPADTRHLIPSPRQASVSRLAQSAAFSDVAMGAPFYARSEVYTIHLVLYQQTACQDYVYPTFLVIQHSTSTNKYSLITPVLSTELNQATSPAELPIVGDPFSEIVLELVFPKGLPLFILNGKKLQLLKPLDRDEENLSHIVFQCIPLSTEVVALQGKCCKRKCCDRKLTIQARHSDHAVLLGFLLSEPRRALQDSRSRAFARENDVYSGLPHFRSMTR
uniref:(California timema) hypothetical protein n=1 Tax=Timema californicum TaxID=61474 RepID=A0A7R9P552_TIMCA|nr:unnamed protein product [Timema californicum]